jgi:hypothetical protein
MLICATSRRELSRLIVKDPTLSRVSVLAVDPGAMASGLAQRGNLSLRLLVAMAPFLASLINFFQPNGILRTTKKSAADIVHASFDTEAPFSEKPNGLYMNGSALGKVGAEAKDEWKCARLWRDSLEWAGEKESETALAHWK